MARRSRDAEPGRESSRGRDVRHRSLYQTSLINRSGPDNSTSYGSHADWPITVARAPSRPIGWRTVGLSTGELRGKVGDGVNQAADLISATASIPSLNFIG